MSPQKTPITKMWWFLYLAMVTSLFLNIGCSSNHSPQIQTGLIHYTDEAFAEGYRVIEAINRTMVVDVSGETVTILPGRLNAFSGYGLNSSMIYRDSLVLLNKKFYEINRVGGIVHHDVTFDTDSTLWVLSSDVHEVFGKRTRIDVIKHLSKDLELLSEWCTFDHLDELALIISNTWFTRELQPFTKEMGVMEYFAQAPNMFSHPNDIDMPITNAASEVFHVNAVNILPPNILESNHPEFKQGNLLVSFSVYGFLIILDPVSFEILWYWNLPIGQGLHTPEMLPNGNILVFVNGTGQVEDEGPFSEILEFNSLTGKRVWTYRASPTQKMFSKHFGSAHRLPNGNTLISEITKGGRVFEVNPEKEIVWEWVYPEIDTSTGLPTEVYRAMWVEQKIIDPLLSDF
jgi:hypothetical protein